jgi:hypothetical protein
MMESVENLSSTSSSFVSQVLGFQSTFFPELNEPARPAAARPASRDASRPAPGGASAVRTERLRKIDNPAATYLPGLATADSS